MSYLLSIAIPTFNRCECLKRAVNSVLAQVKGSEVELIISDNASSDETEAYMSTIVEKFKHVRYFRNSNNIGFSGNLLAAIEKSRGKYIWTMGDDDFVKPGAIGKILSRLKEGTADLLLINFDYFVEGNHNIVQAVIKSMPAFDASDQKKIINHLGRWISLIALCVMRRENIAPFLQDKLLQDNDYAGYYLALSCFGSGRNVCFINEALVVSRRVNRKDLRFNNWTIYAFDYAALLNQAVKNRFISSCDATQLKSEMLSAMVFPLLVSKFSRLSLFSNYKILRDSRWMEYHEKSPAFWSKIMPVCLSPSLLIWIIRTVYRVVHTLYRFAYVLFFKCIPRPVKERVKKMLGR